MKRIGLLLFVLLFSGESWACWCVGTPPLTQDILKKYPYVALVKVTSMDVFTRPGIDTTNSQSAKFTVDVLENFKRALPAEFILESFNTSCDIGLRPGQEWVIFAKEYKGYATVYACDYSMRYENNPTIYYENLWNYRQLPEELLNSIRQLTGRPIKVENNRIEKFYDGGQRALLTTYNQKTNQQERTVWRRNARLWGKEFYKAGVKNGPATWWNANGTLKSTETFLNGIAIDTSRYWYETDNDPTLTPNDQPLTKEARDSIVRVQPLLHRRAIRVTDKQGRLLLNQNFDMDGRLIEETIGQPEPDIEWRTAYDKQGHITFMLVTRTSSAGARVILYRIEYEPDGSRQVAYYDEKGRLIRWTTVKDGLEIIREEKHYPD